MKCGICGEELLETGQAKLACSTCQNDVPVHASCRVQAQTSQLRVGCSNHPVTQLPVLTPSSHGDSTPMPTPTPMGALTPIKEVPPRLLLKKRETESELLRARQEEAELLKNRKVEMEKLHTMKQPQSSMKIPLHSSTGLGRPGGSMMGSPLERVRMGGSMMGGSMMGGSTMGSERAPWAMGASGGGAKPQAQKSRKKNFQQMLEETCTAAVACAPTTRVTYTRLDRLHDAWNDFDFKGCEGEKKCGCARCVTMDVLTMTHIVELKHFEAQLGLLVQYITQVCADEPWALASLMPGKSNFWLCGWLVNSIPKSSRCLPSCLYLTSVNDTRSFLPYPWVEFRDDDSPEPKHVFVLDDVSYSGTQFTNLLRQVRANVPVDCEVYACPLFVTPHAESHIKRSLPIRRPMPSMGSMTEKKKTQDILYWAGRAVLLHNTQLFETLGDHRESKAKNFHELCMLYAGSKAWGDSRWNEGDKTLTTYVPYYKIPDYFSCPERAYIPPHLEKYSDDIRQYTFTAKHDQNPAYKQAAAHGKIPLYLR